MPRRSSKARPFPRPQGGVSATWLAAVANLSPDSEKAASVDSGGSLIRTPVVAEVTTCKAYKR